MRLILLVPTAVCMVNMIFHAVGLDGLTWGTFDRSLMLSILFLLIARPVQIVAVVDTSQLSDHQAGVDKDIEPPVPQCYEQTRPHLFNPDQNGK